MDVDGTGRGGHLGIPLEGVKFTLGDSPLPWGPLYGGSMAMASVGSAVQTACRQAREDALARAGGNDLEAAMRRLGQPVGASAKVALKSTARRLWPGQNPIGQRLLIPHFSQDRETGWRTVIGVVNDVRYRGIYEVQLDVYDPALQASLPADNIVIRTSTDPLALAAPVRALARELDPTAIVDSVTTMEAVVARAEAP